MGATDFQSGGERDAKRKKTRVWVESDRGWLVTSDTLKFEIESNERRETGAKVVSDHVQGPD